MGKKKLAVIDDSLPQEEEVKSKKEKVKKVEMVAEEAANVIAIRQDAGEAISNNKSADKDEARANLM